MKTYADPDAVRILLVMAEDAALRNEMLHVDPHLILDLLIALGASKEKAPLF